MSPSPMDESSCLEEMEKWVFHENRYVTKLFLLRKTGLNALQIQNILQKFISKHEGELSLIYTLFGECKCDRTDGFIKRSLLCKEEDLEEGRKSFAKVHSASIYSIQSHAPKYVQLLLNTDWSGRHERAVTPVSNRLPIECPQAVANIKQWYHDNGKPIESDHKLPQFLPPVKAGPRVYKSMISKSDQHSLMDAFANAAKINEMETQRQKPSIEKSPEIIIDSADIPSTSRPQSAVIPIMEKRPASRSSPNAPKKRARLENSSKSKTKGTPQQKKINAQPKKEEIKIEKPNRIFVDEDVFCTGSDDELKSDVEPEEPSIEVLEHKRTPVKKINKKSPKSARTPEPTSQRKNKKSPKKPKTPEPISQRSEVNATPNGSGKCYRKEKITETYEDDDGYLVSRVVEKMVEVPEDEIKPQKNVLKPKNIIKPIETKKKTASKSTAGQAKISSFFSK